MSFLHRFNKTLLTGLVAILPVVATLYFLVWLARWAESFVGDILRLLLPASWYVPGMGVLIGMVLIAWIGLMMEVLIFRKLVEKFEAMIYHIPLIKSIYGSVREFLSFVSEGKSKGPKQVVAVRVGGTGFKVIGVATRTDLTFLAEEPGQERIAVYMPMSYQIGGYTVLVPRDQVEPLDMPLDKAMRFVMSAGIMDNGPGKRRTAKREPEKPL